VAPEARRAAGIPGLPRNVVALGVVSLFTDLSTAMIVPVLPLFVVGVLRGTAAQVGLIEGVAESTASLLRVVSGWLSDRIGRRKPFLVFGYGVSTVAKAAMGVTGSWIAILGLRFSDRLGKGIRNPPRDALIADSVEPRYYGRAFGFHRALDTIGSALGPLAALAVLSAFPGDYRRVFLLSGVPGVLSVLVLMTFVRSRGGAAAPARREHIAFSQLGAPFYRFVTAAGLFALASSSIAMLLLLAKRAGLDERGVTLVFLLFNVVSAALSWPVGELSDRVGRRPLVLGAYLLFATLYALLAWRATPFMVVVGFAVLGVQSALHEGTEKSLLADLLSRESRATGYGVYHTVVGVALLPASVLAGWIWDRFGPRAMLAADAALALAAATLFLILVPPAREREERRHAVAA
jgi:MFS family permease